MEILRFVGPCFVIFCCIRWFLRERWAGPLLLNASGKPPYRKWQLSFWLALLVSSILFNRKLTLIWWNALAAITYNALLSWRLEFRKVGIVTGSSFYAWRNIASFAWKRSEDTENSLLVLSIRNRPRIPSVNKVPVPEERRIEADGIVQKFVLGPNIDS
jgi:hypothetical protein